VGCTFVALIILIAAFGGEAKLVCTLDAYSMWCLQMLLYV